MEMCIRIWLLKILILIIYLPTIYGNVISFGPEGQVALSERIILICEINGFAGSADLNRNGALINSCSEVNFCSLGPSRNISNAVFKFEGNGLGIKVTIDPLLPEEVGMPYVCSFNSTDKEYNITISSSGGDGTGLTPEAIFGIVFAVLVVVVLAVAVPCCILNTKCKFGDACRDSNLSFTFPPEIKRTITPKSDLDYVNDTPDEERKGNLTPESEPGKKEVTTYQEPKLNYKLNNEESSIAQFTKRSGAFQQLEPVNRGEVGNRNGEYFKPVVTKI